MVFVPLGLLAPACPRTRWKWNRPSSIKSVRLHNHAALPGAVARLWLCPVAGGRSLTDLSTNYDPGLGQGGLVAHSQSHPDWVRLFGVAGFAGACLSLGGELRYRQLYETTNVSPLRNDTSANGGSWAPCKWI